MRNQLVAVSFGALLIGAACTRHPTFDGPKVEALAAIRTGMTRAQVASKLDSMGYRFVYDSTKPHLTAFRRVDSTSIAYADVRVSVTFSPDGRVAMRAVDIVYTGP
ncbi:MAG TPA: hypothetical protein VMS45_10530 [Gemmatimonadaceae bacterium]|nr:hypothetical protein [Gemmatimonadaceae bacterium]